MGKKSRKKAEARHDSDAAIKGRLVEMIIASMHEAPNLKVERNVFLPAEGSDTQRRREIDVLITNYVEGNPTYVVIECKNYKEVIDVPKIDEFFGKLDDLGIPSQQGIYVSVNGFTQGALERAKKAGITPLILTGLTKDRLAATVQDAFQSVVYLLADVTNLSVRASVDGERSPAEMLFFYDEQGTIQGSVLDVLWKRWRADPLPQTLGEHTIDLEIPPSWRLLIDGKPEPAVAAAATVNILGLMITLGGSVYQHLLLNPLDQAIDKFHAHATFDTARGRYPVLTFRSEDQLDQFLRQRREAVKLHIGRIRLPRIRLAPIYWPPSERVSRILSAIVQAHKAGKVPDFQWSDLASIEGDDLQAVWEPIMSNHPMWRDDSSASPGG